MYFKPGTRNYLLFIILPACIGIVCIGSILFILIRQVFLTTPPPLGFELISYTEKSQTTLSFVPPSTEKIAVWIRSENGMGNVEFPAIRTNFDPVNIIINIV